MYVDCRFHIVEFATHLNERNLGYKVEVVWHDQVVQYVLVGWNVGIRHRGIGLSITELSR